MSRIFAFKGLLAASVVVTGLVAAGTVAQAASLGAPLKTGAATVTERLGQQPAIEPVYWVQRHGRRHWVQPRRYHR